MRIVLDTNVLVSGLLSPHRPPGEIVRLVSGGLVSLCLDARIVAEYRDVLARPRFGFDQAALRAARGAKFKPATRDGERIEMWTTVLVSFRLD